jgi:hypothetical protein
MAAGPMFHRLACPAAEARLDIVLRAGQSFRWRPLVEPATGEEGPKEGPREGSKEGPKEGLYVGVARGRLWVVGREGEELIFRAPASPGAGRAELAAELADYLQLGVPLAELYTGGTWSGSPCSTSSTSSGLVLRTALYRTYPGQAGPRQTHCSPPWLPPTPGSGCSGR